MTLMFDTERKPVHGVAFSYQISISAGTTGSTGGACQAIHDVAVGRYRNPHHVAHGPAQFRESASFVLHH
jgi:hypothetical protein